MNYQFSIVVKAGDTVEYQDRMGLLDHMLAKICERDALHPIAVLTAGLVALEQRRSAQNGGS